MQNWRGFPWHSSCLLTMYTKFHGYEIYRFTGSVSTAGAWDTTKLAFLIFLNFEELPQFHFLQTRSGHIMRGKNQEFQISLEILSSYFVAGKKNINSKTTSIQSLCCWKNIILMVAWYNKEMDLLIQISKISHHNWSELRWQKKGSSI